MKIFLIRHGKSDKSLKDVLPHDEFELKRALIEGEEEKAIQLGKMLKEQVDDSTRYDLVYSGKLRSKQTVLAMAKGLGLRDEKAANTLREDFGLVYLTDPEYWEAAETAVKNETSPSYADFFLNNPPQSAQTFSAQYMQQNMRAVLRRAIERNTFLKNETIVMVSHEPVLSLCMSDLTEKSVTELGGSFEELEYATLIVSNINSTQLRSIKLEFRGKTYEVSSKVFQN